MADYVTKKRRLEKRGMLWTEESFAGDDEGVGEDEGDEGGGEGLEEGLGKGEDGKDGEEGEEIVREVKRFRNVERIFGRPRRFTTTSGPSRNIFQQRTSLSPVEALASPISSAQGFDHTQGVEKAGNAGSGGRIGNVNDDGYGVGSGGSGERRVRRWTLQPVLRSEAHPVYIQPVKELVVRRWRRFRRRG